jgi:NAD+ synthase (glutamine-hydrolysing)
MKITIAQLNPTIGDLCNNAKTILMIAIEAANNGTNLLLTPELSLCGYPPRDLLLKPEFIDAMRSQLEQLAADFPENLSGLIGFAERNQNAEEKGEKPLYNSIALIQNNQIKQVFHKQLLPTYDVFDEARYFQSGELPNHFKLDDIHIGVTICEDLWNDEEFWGKRAYSMNPIADLADLNVDFTVNLSASPYTIGKQQTRERMLTHTAIRFNQPIIYVNQVGANDDLIFDGGSFVVNRDGILCDRVPQMKPCNHTICWENQKFVSTEPIAPTLDKSAELYTALVLGVKDYAHKCGFKQALLGLSGGIDSALVAAIAVDALGAENILGILMPSPYSSDHSITDAKQLAQNLGIKTQTVPIEPVMKSYDESLAEIFSGTAFGIAEENLQSRIRGTLLMGISNKFNYLLITTGNKSEIAVGYCTLYGDMNGGLAAIADVPKTKVYALCEWLNRTTEVIPTNIISKPPSAELKPGQLDQDSLPDYEILDDILDRLVQNYESPDQIIAAGHDRTIVEKISRLIKIAEFKRRQSAPGLKVTDRAFGTGWRMPIAQRWG